MPGEIIASMEIIIFNFLERNKVNYEVFEHKPVYTCEQMAKYLRIDPKLVAKSLIMKTSEESFVVAVLPGDKKVDHEKLAKAANVKSVSLASVEEASEIAKCSVGCVYPLGNLMKIKTFFDRSILTFDHIYFNPASHTKSIKVKTEELVKLIRPTIAEFAK